METDKTNNAVQQDEFELDVQTEIYAGTRSAGKHARPVTGTATGKHTGTATGKHTRPTTPITG